MTRRMLEGLRRANLAVTGLAMALAVGAASAGSVSVNGTLTPGASSSSCTYTGLSETSSGNWTVNCGAGSKTITISPSLCGSVCTSYSGLVADSAGNWSVNGCVSAISAGVNLAAPAAPVANQALGSALRLAATASACNGTITKVEFFANAVAIPGSAVTAPPYEFMWTPTVAGNTGIQARATDSTGGVTPSQTVNVYVNAPPVASISVTSPGSSASPPGARAAPATFVLSASATDGNGIARIEFWNGTTQLGSVSGASGSFTWSNVAAGSYNVVARAIDGLGTPGDSTAVSLNVTSTNALPSATLVAPGASASLTAPVTLQASASDNDGSVVRVEFVDSATGQVVATATAGPTYTAQWTSPTLGQHTIFARAVDNSGGSTNSAAVTITVTQPFRVTLTSAPTSTPYFVAPATVRFTLTPIPQPAAALTQVTLYMDDVAQGTFGTGVNLGEWEKSVSVPTGTHRFYARATASDGTTGTSNDTIMTIDGGSPPPAQYSCPAESSVAIGATAGAAAVGESGAAGYSIPIQPPPGIAGVTPSLTLSYSSQAGNGLLGVGWSLQGLSTIQRCAASVFMDGVRGSVLYDASDSLCLDGQRLIRVPSFDAGAVEYRTERETYSRIQALNPFDQGTWAGTAAYFKVSTKSGQVMYYGWKQTETSAPYDDAFLRTMPVATPGKETGRVWALYKIQDKVGNYQRIVYENDQGAGTMRPSYIEYTGNTSMGTAPFARVAFTYETRPDAANLYAGGQKSYEDRRLKSITTIADGTNVKRYTLSYGTSVLSGRSLLQSVQECAVDSFGNNVMCLNPTTFQWTDTEGGARTLAFGGLWNGASTGSNRDTTVAVDIDGDGKTDLVSRRDPQQAWDVCKSTGANYACEIWMSNPRAQGSGRDDVWHFADFDGDGKADLVFLSPDLSGVTMQLSTPAGFGTALRGFVNWPGASNPSANPYAHTVGDFDGDGRTDLALYMGDFNWVFCSYNGNSFNCAGPVTIPGADQPSNSPNAGFDFLVADLNGDGRADLAFHRNNSDQWSICHSTSQIGAFSFGCGGLTTSISDDAYRVHIADVNGDGQADMLAPIEPRATSGDFTAWNVCLSKGDRTFECSAWTGPNVSHDNASLGDFNGDGRTDIVWYKAGVGWRACESRGSSFSCDSASRGSGVAPMDALKNLRMGDFNGDGKTDLAIWTSESSATWTVGLAGGAPTDLARRATNGMGIASVFAYKPLTDTTVYTKGTSAVYPEIDIQSPLYVVSRMETSTLAPQPWYGLDYSYRGLRGHAQGAGLAGFAGRIVVDSNTDNAAVAMCSETLTFASWSDRRIGLPSQASKRYGPSIGVGSCTGGTLLSQVSNTWESRKSNTFNGLSAAYGAPAQSLPIWEVFLTGSTETKADLNGASMPTSQMSTPMSSIDALGNPTYVSTATWRISPSSDQYSKVTSSNFINDVGANWIIGRVSRTTVTNAVPYAPVNANYTRVSSFTYYPTSGLLWTETIEPDRSTSGSERLDTSYGYDGFGNRNSVTVNGLAVTNRTTTTRYCINGQSSASCAQDGRFPTFVRNAVGHVELRQFDTRFGAPTRVTGPNNLTVASSYDKVGRKYCESRPDGSTTGWTWSTPSDVPGGSYVASTSDSTGAANQQHFDALNREVGARVKTFDGGWATTTGSYDYRGRKFTSSKPYGDITGTWTYFFDDLNRVRTEQGPGGYSATHAYNGMITSTTVVGQSGSQTTTRTNNNRGEVVATVDARGSTLQLQYDPTGNMERKSVAVGLDGGSGATTTIYFNSRGQKTGMNDPDQGAWTYGYDALGAMTRQVDGNGITTTFVYDNIGRLTQRVLAGISTTWTYDACGQGSIGKLCRVADNKTSRDLGYDGVSRLARTKVTLFDGRWYERFTTYDAMSRVSRIVYPVTGLTLLHSYNAAGYMSGIDELTTIGNRATWRANSRYMDGQIKSESIRSASSTRTYDALGRVSSIVTPNVQNSTFTFDALGNLTARGDTVIGMSESFTYDLLNRLSTVSGTGGARSYQYDSLGNMTYRSDIGVLTYRPGTHQLSQVGAVSYSYDPNGNLGSAADFSRTVSYWPSGRVSSIMSYPPGVPSQAKGYSYEYDADLQRSIEYRMVGNSSNSTTHYFFDGITPFFEEDHEYDAVVGRVLTWKHYVSTPEGVNQLIVIKNDAANTRADRLFARDHLGSTMIVFGDGNPEYQGFDAWGRRRDIAGSPNPPTKTDRGFTGHEMMDDVGLVNMNGRIYDPALGRMMQADPVVQAPLNLQSYNRYSYVINNPLSFTDPTGYSWWTDKGRPVFRAVGAMVAAYFTAGAASGWITSAYASSLSAVAEASAWTATAAEVAAVTPSGIAGLSVGTVSGIASGAAAGFASGGIMGGNLNSALSGAFSGALGGGINGYYGSSYPISRVAANAVAGGISSRVSGGSFEQGFKGALLNSLLTYANVQMRTYQINLSKMDARNDGTGYSWGMFGDGFKLGGGRFDFSGPYCSNLGCEQKGYGSIFGWKYGPGSFRDMVVESFSGPHDHANMPLFYDEVGNIKALSPMQSFFGEIGNYTTSLAFAAPFALAAIREQTYMGTAPFAIRR